MSFLNDELFEIIMAERKYINKKKVNEPHVSNLFDNT